MSRIVGFGVYHIVGFGVYHIVFKKARLFVAAGRIIPESKFLLNIEIFAMMLYNYDKKTTKKADNDMEQINNMYDVFISYHGGNTSGEYSSYQKAAELKRYFENHAGKKLKCFLCKDEKHDDFYDAINEALVQAKHFILVACDRSMLSKWVADELKQFDGLRKIGKKPNSVVNAYIFGTIKVDDLLTFNTVFSTKDIAFGDHGFESLYNMIAEKENYRNKNLCFDYSNKTIAKYIYSRPISHRFYNKVQKYISASEITEEMPRKLNDDTIAFEACCANELCATITQESEAFVFLRVCHPVSIAEYLLSFGHTKQLNIFLIDYQSKSAALLIDGNLIAIPNLSDIRIVLSNETIQIEADDTSEHSPIIFNTNRGVIELPTTDYNEFGNIVCYEKGLDDFGWEDTGINISNTGFCLYILNALYHYVVPKGSVESEELFDEIDFCSMEQDEPYDSHQMEKKITDQKEKSVVKLENLLWQYYRSIKSGSKFGEQDTKDLFTSRYSDIAYSLKNYYTRHSVNTLLDVLRKIFEFAVAECESGFYSKYEYLMMMLSEVHLHNIFILDYQFMIDHDIYNTLVNLYKHEYVVINQNRLRALICSYRKEIYFCGKFEQLGMSGANAHEILLDEFEKTIDLMESSNPNIEQNEYKAELILLYRERCVIWEHCGDMTLKQSERKKFYSNWKADCERALVFGNLIDCDKELQGCVYLNLASSINRLSVYEKDQKLTMLNECLKYLDTALEMFKICATDRYIAYAYLHKGDCYEAILIERVLQQGEYIVADMSGVVDEIRRNSTHALNLFKGTSDDLAKCWAIRLSVKGKVLSANNYGTADAMRNGMKTLREALRYCLSSNYVNGMAACVRDFTFYNQIIIKEGIQFAVREDIEKTFFDEILVFASIIKLLKLDMDDIIEVQQQLEKLVEKMID